jgi:hypothetical protein
MKIAALMGDREFIGDTWMAYLQRENIPFILRLRENQHVLREGYVALPISVIAQHLMVGGPRWSGSTGALAENSPPRAGGRSLIRDHSS